MCFCVLLYFTACMLYYCNMVGWAWRDWGLIWWLTILLQRFDTVGWVTWPVKISSPNDLYCVEWDVKPYSTTLVTNANREKRMRHALVSLVKMTSTSRPPVFSHLLGGRKLHWGPSRAPRNSNTGTMTPVLFRIHWYSIGLPCTACVQCTLLFFYSNP